MADEQKRLRQQILLQRIEILLEADNRPDLGELLKEQRSSDIAEVVELLDNEQGRIIFDVLDKPTAAEVLEKVDEATRGSFFELLAANEIKGIISELDLDDAADLLQPKERFCLQIISDKGAALTIEKPLPANFDTLMKLR